MGELIGRGSFGRSVEGRESIDGPERPGDAGASRPIGRGLGREVRAGALRGHSSRPRNYWPIGARREAPGLLQTPEPGVRATSTNFSKVWRWNADRQQSRDRCAVSPHEVDLARSEQGTWPCSRDVSEVLAWQENASDRLWSAMRYDAGSDNNGEANLVGTEPTRYPEQRDPRLRVWSMRR